ncbi:MAG: hypothetical protein V2I33_16450 [Kangiellaceae bacterium]|nr:hypothetical protein [Kangiellaceae bacterium]
MVETIFNGDHEYRFESYFTGSCDQDVLITVRKRIAAFCGEKEASSWFLDAQSRIFKFEEGIRLIRISVEEVQDVYEHLGIPSARSCFEQKPGQYLVVSDSADEARYYHCDKDYDHDAEDDEYIDRDDLTLIGNVNADSEEDAIAKVHRQQEIPEWINLFCYRFR